MAVKRSARDLLKARVPIRMFSVTSRYGTGGKNVARVTIELLASIG